MHTDPLADMLTRIRNASAVYKAEVRIPYSKMKLHIAHILEKEGYVAAVRVAEKPVNDIILALKYEGKKRAISHIRRVSKPGKRSYSGKSDIPKVLSGYGIAIITTSKGVMTSNEARKKGVGGEIVCEVY
ncbi:MAG: 30S ribosomal protein S8 [Parcubacteria group bacterium CG08_land_8_20_14_0_20_48_21]|nr:MAG: 30S ribosomal protein S8 [Parcubacteria group bacterium CG2_30_48_51]PIS32638.1 MAG: 30S ribosomal protein S8 [Parcubacteria group bacterium CG08_land_8_20_14_0_20_48_21]PIW79301.1 MAG: 30S ribosomal protein S8 [Parcubacteria group bacterium CG_4_8_14_3_um_filter_48_16]PIY77602.1 MAG: 30S ribosomal protein S8 [Parcubacteria group bacterium CG_4_10_14_0_8_um_filter_48_154]PIZ77187.1 MAG: 30S ribosomal protein S8 [bacterium CG_4_10_14_0_2_um_filter_48_144]PJC40141.1 MAG: 30S ribosomal pr